MSKQNKELNPKSSLLWNVVDPDDPYDIRKSMIVRLPEHTQNYMGGHLQIVCLMQAAEIQRLNIYLSQFKLKYRELQRKQLDRHSYQILIKQLTQKANQYSKARTDNQKLRQFIKRQSQQIQQLSKRPNISSSMENEHQQLLKNYQKLLNQLQTSRQKLDSQTITILKLTEQNKELRIKYDKLDKQRLTELTKQRQKYQLKIQQRISIEIKQVEHRFSNKIYQLESDCKLYKQQIQSKNHQITNLLAKIKALQKDLEAISSQKGIEFQQKILELQSINISLKNKIVQLQTFQSKYRHIQIQLIEIQKAFQRSQQQNRLHRNQLDRYSSLFDRQKNANNKDLQQKTRQLQRINITLSMKATQLERIYNQYTSIQDQLHQAEKILKRSQQDNRYYRSEIDKLNSIINKLRTEGSRQANMKVEQLQNKLALLSSQVQRLTFMMDNKNQALLQAETKNNSIRNEYQSRIRLITSQYESKLSKKQSQYIQMQTMQTQIKTLRTLNLQLKTRNQSLGKQISHATNMNRRVYELEQQIKKLSLTISTKNEQIYNLQTKIRSNQSSNTNTNAENIALRKNLLQKDRMLQNLSQECLTFEEKIRGLLKQVENKQQLRKQLQKEVMNSYQLKNNYQNSKILLSQGQQIAQKLKKQMFELKKVVQQYELDIKKGLLIPSSKFDAQIQRSIEQYRRRANTQKQIQIRKILQQKSTVQRNYSQLFQHKKLLEGEINQLQQKLNKKQRQSYQSVTIIETKYVGQIQQLKNSYKLIRQQNDKIVAERNRLLTNLSDIQRQISLRNKQQADYQNKIQTLIRDNQELKRNNTQLYQQNSRLNRQSQTKSQQIRRENARLRQELSYSQQKLPALQRQIQMKTQQIRNQSSQITRLKQQLSSVQQSYTSSRRQLEQKIQQYRIQNVRIKQQISTTQQIHIIKRDLQSKNDQLRSQNNLIKQQVLTLKNQITTLNQRILNIRNQNQYKIQQLHRDNARLKQELVQAQQRSIYIQKQLQQKLAKLPLQLQQKQNITISLQRQLQTARQQIKSLQTTYQNSNLTMKNYRERLLSVSQQIQRLNRILQQKNNQIQSIKRQFDRMQPTYQKQLQDKNTQINSMQSLIGNLQANIRNKQQQIIALKSPLQSYQAKQRTYKGQLKQKQDEINSLRSHTQRIQSTYSKQLTQKQQLIKSLRTQYQTFDSTIKKYIRDLKEKDQYIAGISQNQQGIQRKLFQKEQVINTLRAKLENIQATYVRQLRQKDEQIRVNGEKILRLAHQKDSLQRQIRMQYESKIKTIVENEQKSLITQKNSLIMQIQKHTMTIRSYESKIQIMTTQRQQLLQQISQIQRNRPNNDIYIIKQREQQIQISNLRQIIRQLQEINQHTTQERDKLFQLSHEYKQELQNYKRSQKQQHRGQQAYIQITNKYNQLTLISIRYQQENKRLQTQLQQTSRQKKQYEIKLNQTIVQIERLTRILTQMKQKQNVSELMNRIAQLQTQNANCQQVAKQWEAKYVQLYQMYINQTQKSRNIINQYQIKIKMLEQRFQEVALLVNNSKQENKELRDQLNSYNDLIQKNRILSAEIDRLNIIVNNLKQELSDTRLRLTDQMALEKRLEQYVTLMVVLFAQIQTLRNRVSATQRQCEDVRRSSLTPHRVDRQANISKSLQRGHQR